VKKLSARIDAVVACAEDVGSALSDWSRGLPFDEQVAWLARRSDADVLWEDTCVPVILDGTPIADCLML
jgi:hypothetical protein